MFVYKFNRRFVSRAITNSSLVGITKTLTFELGVLIKRSPVPFTLASSSISTHKASFNKSQIPLRAKYEFSPIPAVKQIASTPPKAMK